MTRIGKHARRSDYVSENSAGGVNNGNGDKIRWCQKVQVWAVSKYQTALVLNIMKTSCDCMVSAPPYLYAYKHTMHYKLIFTLPF